MDLPTADQTWGNGGADSIVRQKGPVLVGSDLFVQSVTDRDELTGFSHGIDVVHTIPVLKGVEVRLLHQEWDPLMVDEEEVQLLSEKWVLPIKWCDAVVQEPVGCIEVIDHHRLILADGSHECL